MAKSIRRRLRDRARAKLMRLRASLVSSTVYDGSTVLRPRKRRGAWWCSSCGDWHER